MTFRYIRNTSEDICSTTVTVAGEKSMPSWNWRMEDGVHSR